MRKISNAPRHRALVLAGLIIALITIGNGARAQTVRDADRGYSDADAPAAATSRPRTTTQDKARDAPLGDTPTEILRAARTIYISPNQHINADYLEYKLDKLPEFSQWQLSFVKKRERADLIIEIEKSALNYIFSVVEPESSIAVAKGKDVAINGRVAAEDISHRIVKRMRAIRALPAH